MTLTDQELENIAHGLGHYDLTHGNLPLFNLVRYTCDPPEWGREIAVGYRDTREVFQELLEARQEVKNLRKALESKPASMIVTTEELEKIKKDFGVEK